MEYYAGDAGDKPSGGGSFIDLEGYGYEMFNFKPVNGRYYGFVQVTGGIALERLGGEKGAESVSNITVVFVTPLHGQSPYVICGWYRKATIYRIPGNRLAVLTRAHRGQSISYNLEAKQEDSYLLPVDERLFTVSQGFGWIGQSRIWYADRPERREFVQHVRQYVETKKLAVAVKMSSAKRGAGWHQDLQRRQLIEKNAIHAVWHYYEALGYKLESVELQNLGWDLEATAASSTLRLEVKGTSGSGVACEVTPNEYKPIREKRRDYRLCVVAGALSKAPEVKIFGWSQEREGWYFQDEQLAIKELTGARLSA